MSVLIWIAMGLVAGSIASMGAVGGEIRYLMTNLVLGLFGAFVGGGVVHLLGTQVGVSGFNVWSVLASALGAAGVLVAARFVAARRDSWSN